MRSSARKASLSRYIQKRDFSKTAEPRDGGTVAESHRLRFVIQKHAARALHYDLRLELGGVFKSWAVTKGPSVDPAVKRLAVEVEDHPLEYGDFEGAIAKGQYGGGTVQLWDRGYWKPEGTQTPQQALKKGDLKFSLDGKRLKGSWVLVRIKNDRYGAKRTNWLLIKHRDAAAKPGDSDSLLEKDASVASGRTMQQIAAGRGKQPQPFMNSTPAESGKATRRAQSIPRFVPPQLCLLVDQPPSQIGWVHEVKFDGYRAQLRVQNGKAVLRTRRGLDWTQRFMSIAAAAQSLPDCLIDGEIVALDKNHLPDFAQLQAALSNGHSDSLTFFAFDLLFDGGRDVRELPLLQRKERLKNLLIDLTSEEHIRYVEHFDSHADSMLQSACKLNFRGYRLEAF